MSNLRPLLSTLRTSPISRTALRRALSSTSRLRMESPPQHPHQQAAPSGLWNMLESDIPLPIQVKTTGLDGIHLVDGLKIRGPCLFLEGRVWLWDVPPTVPSWGAKQEDQDAHGWKREQFEILDTLVPKPEILLFGTGRTTIPLPKWFKDFFDERGIGLDVMDTKNACSTYNVLTEEGRRVGAALLPILPWRWEKSSTVENN
ncbi:DUF498-domain-containing protein [Flagelloscypha sp. PMI_526]|nr:DUF498-domain-containing protein [Flagelloscypha sp. PMI_526]